MRLDQRLSTLTGSSAREICLRKADARPYAQCVARVEHDELVDMLWIDLTSVYVRRAMGRLPKQDAHAPGKLSQSYLRDIGALRFGRIEDGVFRFETAGPRRQRSWLDG